MALETLQGQKAKGTSSSSDWADAKASEITALASSTTDASIDKNRHYDVVPGVVVVLGTLWWHLKSKNKSCGLWHVILSICEIEKNVDSIFLTLNVDYFYYTCQLKAKTVFNMYSGLL